jgi:hypothetical protein
VGAVRTSVTLLGQDMGNTVIVEVTFFYLIEKSGKSCLFLRLTAGARSERTACQTQNTVTLSSAQRSLLKGETE